ncbi:MAG: hypothetical protein AAGH79_07025 [Bacteroidota bacterium]
MNQIKRIIPLLALTFLLSKPVEAQVQVAIGFGLDISPQVSYTESVGRLRTSPANFYAAHAELVINDKIILQGKLNPLQRSSLSEDFMEEVRGGFFVVGGAGYIINGSEDSRIEVPVMAHVGGAFLSLTNSVVDGCVQVGAGISPRVRIIKGLFAVTDLRYQYGISVAARAGTISQLTYGLGLQYRF